MNKQRQRRTRTRWQVLLEQRMIGLLLVVLSALIMVVCAHGVTAEDQDATAILLILPLGLYLLFTKKICIYW